MGRDSSARSPGPFHDTAGEAEYILVMAFRLAALPLVLAVAGSTGSRAATFVVTSAGDDGPGTLRRALQDANATPGADVVQFSIPGSGPHTVTPASGLPPITDTVTIDGGAQGIEVSGASSPAAFGLEVTGQ